MNERLPTKAEQRVLSNSLRRASSFGASLSIYVLILMPLLRSFERSGNPWTGSVRECLCPGRMEI